MPNWINSTTIKIIAINKYVGIEFVEIYKLIFNSIQRIIGINPNQAIDEMKLNRMTGLNAPQRAVIKSLPLLYWIYEDENIKYHFEKALDNILETHGVDFASIKSDLYYEYQNPGDEKRKDKYLAQGYK